MIIPPVGNVLYKDHTFWNNLSNLFFQELITANYLKRENEACRQLVKMMLLTLMFLIFNHITIFALSANITCKHDWKWKCPSENKCISKSLICDGVKHCLNGEDELKCSTKYCTDYFQSPKWKCPGNQTKCISLEKVCNGNIDCENNEDEGEICTKGFCKSIGKTFCPNRNICSKEENVCKNCFRSYHCNEHNCTETFCKENLGKMSCPNENRCIDKRFACDGKRCSCHCLSKCECEHCNDGYEDSEEYCNDFCQTKNMFACPYIDDNTVYAQCSFNCHIPTHIATRSLLIKKEFLWKCPHQSMDQFISKDNICDGIPQCSLGQDESVIICGTLNIYSVLAITMTFVILSAISIYMARRTQLIPLKCNKCDKPFRRQVKMRYNEWKSKLIFLSYMLKSYCPELENNKKTIDPFIDEKIEEIYKVLHRENLGDIYFYIVNRIESIFTLSMFFDAIQKKHLIMKKLYELELSVHHNDHKTVVRCLQSKIGASTETDAILDFRNPPTLLTKFISVVSVAIKRISLLRIGISFIKVITLTFDIIRDYILLYEMGKAIVNSYDGTGDYVTTNDFIILFSFIAASFYAHIFIGMYVYHNRYVVLSTCSHTPSMKSEFILFGLCTIAFPLLGAATVMVNYLEQYNLDTEFKMIQDEEWNEKMISKKRFQDILMQKYRMKKLIIEGFPTIKVIESTLESYYQILIVLILLFKDAYDGVLNQQIIGMGTQEISINRLIFFVGTSLLSFMFLAWSVVDFISKHQGDSINIPGKVILMQIYLVQLFLGILMTLASTFSRMEYGDMFPLYLNITIVVIKLMLLMLYAIFQSDLRKSRSTLAIFVLPNTVTPIPFGPLRGGGIANKDNGVLNIWRLDELKILWIINFCELLIRGILITAFVSNESLSALYLTKQYIWIILLLSLGAILILWKIFFQYAYLFRDIMYDKESLEEHIIEDKGDETDKCEEIPLQDKVQKAKEDIIIKYKKVSSPFSFLMTLISVLGIIITIILCYPSIRAQNYIYKDCGEVSAQKLDNGVYTIWKDILRSSKAFTTCVDGKTLVQKTDPDSGNKRLFFQRPINEYINGFGSTTRDYFLGLGTMKCLVDLGNNILTLEAVTHNGSNFKIRFYNVKIDMTIIDNYPYFQTQQKNKSMHYILSYDKPDHGYLLVRPNYLNAIENKTEKSSYFRFEDYHFASFTAPDDSEDNVCAHQFKSGWWFPLRYARTISSRPFCAHNPHLESSNPNLVIYDHKSFTNAKNIDLSTNLNGVYRDDEATNERGIVYCGNRSYSQCFNRPKGDERYYFTTGTIIKLRSTKLFLSR